MNNHPRYQRYLFTTLLGIAGGLIALTMRLPVPWLIGSLFFCAVASHQGLPTLPLPKILESWMRVAIGVSLGPSVAASVQTSSSDLPFAIMAAVLVTTLSVYFGMKWFRSRTDFSPASAYLAAMPGGLSMLMALSGELDNRSQVVLAHTVRVVIVVMFISLLARVMGVPPQANPIMASLDWSSDASPLILMALIAANFLLAEKLAVAGGHVIFPMITTALLVGFTGLPLEPPAILQTVALLVFGIVLGCEVARQPASNSGRLSMVSAIFTVAVMLFVALLALLLSHLMGQSFLVLFLALAPGGIAEISLVALALGLDAGLVALVHSCRFLFIVLAGVAGLGILKKHLDK